MPLDTDAAAVAGDVMREKCEASSRILARQTVYGLPVVDSWPRPSRANRTAALTRSCASGRARVDEVLARPERAWAYAATFSLDLEPSAEGPRLNDFLNVRIAVGDVQGEVSVGILSRDASQSVSAP
jgi:hypothetical protein